MILRPEKVGRRSHIDPQNPNATLPTLTVEGKVYTDTIDVTSYFVQHAKEHVKTGSSLITKIHEDAYDPNFRALLAVSDPVILWGDF